MAGYRLSKAADADLFSIALYTVKTFGPRQAAQYASEFEDCFALIADQPQAGLARDDIRLGLRSFVQKSHIVYYIETDGGVLIVRVLHARQDPAKHM